MISAYFSNAEMPTSGDLKSGDCLFFTTTPGISTKPPFPPEKLNLPQFVFHRCLVEMIMFPRSIVLLVKAMYQSAFLGLEFSQNTVTLSTAPCKRTQHCWMLHVASVCTPCCTLFRKVWNSYFWGTSHEPAWPGPFYEKFQPGFRDQKRPKILFPQRN